MNTPHTGLRAAAIVFMVLALAQLSRLVLHPEVLVAGYTLPLWPSAIAVVFLAALAAWLWNLSNQSPRIAS